MCETKKHLKNVLKPSAQPSQPNRNPLIGNLHTADGPSMEPEHR